MVDSEIDLSLFVDGVDPLSMVLAGLIIGPLMPNHKGRLFLIGWSICIKHVMEHRTRYVWGPLILLYLYKDMHEAAYCNGSDISTGMTLLHVWTWERILVTSPNGILDRDEDDPYSYRYSYFLHYT